MSLSNQGIRQMLQQEEIRRHPEILPNLVAGHYTRVAGIAYDLHKLLEPKESVGCFTSTPNSSTDKAIKFLVEKIEKDCLATFGTCWITKESSCVS